MVAGFYPVEWPEDPRTPHYSIRPAPILPIIV